MAVDYPEPVADAIRGIRANAGLRKTKVYDRRREWGGALVKQMGKTYVVSSTGAIHVEEQR